MSRTARPRAHLVALVTALLVLAGLGAAQSALASGPGWVNHGSDGYCTERWINMNWSGGTLNTAADFVCVGNVNVQMSVKRDGWLMYQAQTGTRFSHAWIYKSFGQCYIGQRYQVVVTYWTPTYARTISTGSPIRLC